MQRGNMVLRCQATGIGRATLATTTPRLNSSRSGSVERVLAADRATSGQRVRRFWTTAILPPPWLPSACCTGPPTVLAAPCTPARLVSLRVGGRLVVGRYEDCRPSWPTGGGEPARVGDREAVAEAGQPG